MNKISRKVSLEESKKIMYEILKSVDDCCRKHNLRYTLDWGTLLGAVRHHGFIPWDDDIDLSMPREDFNKFREVFNNDRYDVLTTDDPQWGWNYMRICDKTTIVIFDANTEKIRRHGLWLSIFPIDGIPDSTSQWEIQKKKINFFHGLCRLKRSGWTDGVSFIRNFLKMVARLTLKLVPMTWLAKKEEFWLSKVNIKDSEMSFQRDIDYHARPSRYYFDYVDLDFEGGKFMAMAEYHKYLTDEFGDYMQFPPEDQRVPSHGYVAYYK